MGCLGGSGGDNAGFERYQGMSIREKMKLPPIKHAPERSRSDRDRNRVRMDCPPATAKVVMELVSSHISGMGVEETGFDELFGFFTNIRKQLEKVTK